MHSAIGDREAVQIFPVKHCIKRGRRAVIKDIVDSRGPGISRPGGMDRPLPPPKNKDDDTSLTSPTWGERDPRIRLLDGTTLRKQSGPLEVGSLQRAA
jgi:hypothetical protein